MTISTMAAPTTNIYLFVHPSIDLAFNTYAVKLSRLFMLCMGTVWRRTGVMPRPLVYFTYLLTLVILFAISPSLWLLVSVFILITNLRGKEV
jgi:hypothetical protein